MASTTLSTRRAPDLSPGEAPTDRRSPWVAAARADLATVAPSVVPFGIALGLTARLLGEPPEATILGAGLIYAGSAQLTATTTLAAGTGTLAVLAAALVVNSRLLLYGAALQPLFRQQPLAFRLLGAHFVIDGTYVAAIERRHLQPAEFRRYWWALGLGVLVAWTAGVAAGVVLAPLLPGLPHLGLVSVALFLSMLLPRLTNRPAVASACAAAVVAPVVAHLVPSLGILAGAVAGLAAGASTRRRTP